MSSSAFIVGFTKAAADGRKGMLPGDDPRKTESPQVTVKAPRLLWPFAFGTATSMAGSGAVAYLAKRKVHQELDPLLKILRPIAKDLKTKWPEINQTFEDAKGLVAKGKKLAPDVDFLVSKARDLAPDVIDTVKKTLPVVNEALPVAAQAKTEVVKALAAKSKGGMALLRYLAGKGK